MLRRFGMTLLTAAVIVAGAAVLSCAGWSPIGPAVADGGGGNHGRGGGEGQGDGGGSNSGPGGGGDQHDDGESGDDGSGDDGSGAGHAAGRGADHDYVRDELVVANLTGKAKREIGGLGFLVVEERPFAALGLTVARLRVPARMSAPMARTLLTARYPELLVDLNALYRPQGQLVLPARDYAQRLIGWGRAPAGCGAGLRIGLLDSAVDNFIPALRDARIVQRSFLSGDARSAGHDHGTAVAAILVGQPAAGGNGLLPGAGLSIGEVFARNTAGESVAPALALVGGLDWLVEQRVSVVNLSLAGDANRLVAVVAAQDQRRRTGTVGDHDNGHDQARPAAVVRRPRDPQPAVALARRVVVDVGDDW